MKLTNFNSVVDTYKDNFRIRKKRFFDEKKQIREKKRKEREENIETVKAVEPLIKTSTGKTKKPNNFLDGIYKFLGFALAGLVLGNLDSIISIASGIYKKIKELKEGIDNFVTSLQDTIDSFYSGFESFKQGLDDLLSPILNADLSNIIPFQNELEKVLTATLNVVDKIFGESEESSTPPLGRNLNPSRPGSGVKPPKPTSPKPKSTSPFKLEQARKKTTTTKLYRGTDLGRFKAPDIPRAPGVKPPPLLSSVSTTSSSSTIKSGINVARLLKSMRSGIVNPGNLKYLRNLGNGFIAGMILDYVGMTTINKGFELVGMDDNSIIQRRVKKYMESSDNDKKEYLKKLNNNLRKEIEYQKSSAFVVRKIIAMGGQVPSDKKIKMIAGILTNIAAVSGDDVLSSDINVNDLPEVLRTSYEQSSSRQPSPSRQPSSISGGAKGVLDVIASVESSGSYDIFNTSRGGTPGKATEKTIGWLAQNAQGAIGRYQHMPEFILGRAKRYGYDANTLFTPEVQDDLTIKMMQEQHGLDDFLSGKMSAETFAAKLAPTWRGLPQGPKAASRLGGSADSTYNDQYSSGNKAHMLWADSVSNFERIQSGAGQIKTTNTKSTLTPTPTPPTEVKPKASILEDSLERLEFPEHFKRADEDNYDSGGNKIKIGDLISSSPFSASSPTMMLSDGDQSLIKTSSSNLISSAGLNQPTSYAEGGFALKREVNNIIIPIAA